MPAQIDTEYRPSVDSDKFMNILQNKNTSFENASIGNKQTSDVSGVMSIDGQSFLGLSKGQKN